MHQNGIVLLNLINTPTPTPSQEIRTRCKLIAPNVGFSAWIFFFCLPIYISLTLNLQYVVVSNTYDLWRATLKRTQYWISSCRSIEETIRSKDNVLYLTKNVELRKPENDARCYGTKALQYYIINQSDSNGVLCYNWLKCSKYSVY